MGEGILDFSESFAKALGGGIREIEDLKLLLEKMHPLDAVIDWGGSYDGVDEISSINKRYIFRKRVSPSSVEPWYVDVHVTADENDEYKTSSFSIGEY